MARPSRARKALKWIVISGAALFVLFLAVLLVALIWLKGVTDAENRSREAKLRAELEAPLRRHLEAFRNDLNILAQSDFFLPRTRGWDAAPFLSPKVQWISAGRDDLVARWNERARAEGLVLPGSLLEQLRRWDKAWLAHADEIDVRTVNFEWMRQLEEFDYWDLDAASPIFKQLESDPHSIGYFDYPTPSWQIGQWAKLRLINALQEPDPGGAFRQVRALARLVYSSESLIGALVGLRILEEEGQAYDRLRSQGRAPKQWSPIAPDVVRRAMRVLGAAPAFATLFTPEDAATTYFAHGSGVALCVALKEGLESAWHARPFLLPAFPKDYERLDRALEQSKKFCRLRNPRLWWSYAPAPPRPPVGPTIDGVLELLRRVPSIKASADTTDGLALLRAGYQAARLFNSFRRYEEAQ